MHNSSDQPAPPASLAIWLHLSSSRPYITTALPYITTALPYIATALPLTPDS